MSVAGALRANLDITAVFCCVLLLGLLLHKMARVFSRLVVLRILFGGTPLKQSPPMNPLEQKIRRFGRMQFLAGGTAFLLQTAISILRFLVACLRALQLCAYTLLPLLVVSLVWALVVQERWVDLLVTLADSEGLATVRWVFMVPFSIMSTIGDACLPVYNLFAFAVTHILWGALMWLVGDPKTTHVVSGLREAAGAASPFAAAAAEFVRVNGQGLQAARQSLCNDTPASLTCAAYRSQDLTAQGLFDTKRRGLDFMPAFRRMRKASEHMVLSLGASCQAIALLSNITFFPATDLSAWKAVHCVLNAALGATVVAIATANERCELAGGVYTRPSMCTADVAPAFEWLAEAGAHVGDVLTHWASALYLLLLYEEGGEGAQLTDGCNQAVNYSAVWNDPAARRLFGDNVTVLVRMLPSTFALTDGAGVVFVSEMPLRSAYAPGMWAVNPGYGVARTLLPAGVDTRDGGVGLFGCACDDAPFRIRCQVAARGAATQPVEVAWSLAAETQLLTCDRVRISVQSLRWPQRRVVLMSQPQPQQQLAADVALYVIPICGAQDGVKAMACFPEQFFARGICFPYCLGLRMQHEDKAILTVRGAAEWTDGVVFAMRECGSAPDGDPTAVSCGASQSAGASGGTACAYSWGCTSAAPNRSAVEGYRDTPLPTFFAQSPGARLLLDGQPLAVAGGVQMRSYTTPEESATAFVDFPTLVGNQFNEFTIESNLPLGAPVASYAAWRQYDENPSQEDGYIQQPAIAEPPLYVPRGRNAFFYNPAALSTDAFWYATNPSYDWMSAFSDYCRTRGEAAYTQLMLLSTYRPPRLQRVRYYGSACFLEPSSRRRICATDLFTSIVLPRAMSGGITADTLTSELYSLCATGELFDLWVESIEYFDASNMVLTVRRGTVAFDRMIRVYYFVKVSDVRQIREGAPWRDKEEEEQSELFFMGACPSAMSMLPDFGGFVGHSLAAVVRLARMPVNFVLNPFAIAELIHARALRACPENSLAHTALADCGMRLLSLDEFFASVYSGNTAFWDVVAWCISVVMSDNTADDRVRNLLDGATVMGDATRILTLFEVEHSVEIMDTGIQDTLMEGRRRRLLGMAAKGAMGALNANVKFGVKGALGLTKLLSAVASMSMFGGADLGILLSSQDPRIQLAGAAATAPPIAWAHFTYVALTPIVLDVIAMAVHRGKENGTLLLLNPSISPVWMHMHTVLGRFDSIIDARQERACLGLRLMIGYSNALGEGFFHSCMAAVAYPRAMLSLGPNFFVDGALYRCLCVHPAGEDYTAYVQAQCADLVMPTRREIWQSVFLAPEKISQICDQYIGSIETNLIGTFDKWAMHAEGSARELGHALHEIILPTAETCDTAGGSTVLTPMPVSHYHVCARTSLCDARCADVLALFRSELARVQAPHTAPQSFEIWTESPLFNAYRQDASDGGESDAGNDGMLAIASLPSINATTACRTVCAGGRCVAALHRRRYAVRFYCVPDPNMLMSTVFPTALDTFELENVEHFMQDATLRHAEILWRGTASSHPPSIPTMTVLLYAARLSVSPSTQQAREEQHEIHIWRGDAYSTTLRAEELARRSLLSSRMQAALYGEALLRAELVGSAAITAAVAMLGSRGGQWTLHIAFAARLRGYARADGALQEAGHTLHASVVEAGPDDARRIFTMHFYVPCPDDIKEQQPCNARLDTVLSLARLGTFYFPSSAEGNSTTDLLLYLPSAGTIATSADDAAKRARLLTPDDLQERGGFAMTGDEDIKMTWARADIFSPLGWSKPPRDTNYYSPPRNCVGHSCVRLLQVDTWQDMGGPWLQELRPTRISGTPGFRMVPFKSQQTAAKAKLTSQCTSTACTGCSTPRLRLLCAAVQDCALTRCIGTTVQTRNVLCGIGGVIEQTSLHAIATWRAMYGAFIEIALLVMRGASRDIAQRITLRFPTDQFYALLCTCKDMYARVVGLGMGLARLLGEQKLRGVANFVGGDSGVGAIAPQEDTIKSAAIASLFFNMIAGSTLLPTLALHRWMICTANASAVSQPEGALIIQFGDVTMDDSWMPCASLGGLVELLNGNDVEGASRNKLEEFVSFTLSLLSGIGETILYGMQLSFDSSLDYVSGLVWNVQDILFAFNARQCKVPNYALRYVMACACGDAPYRIPLPQRGHTLEQGGLWCVGTLNIERADGSIGIVYNPYPLDTLSRGVEGVTAYIECLSESSDCTPPSASAGLLPILVQQGVDPIAVWARCKANYALSAWDTGAGALFSYALSGDGSDRRLPSAVTAEIRDRAVEWARAVSPELLACMRDAGRFEFTVCLRLYHSITNASTPAAYFLYSPDSNATAREPPDACLVLSGLRAAASDGSPLQTLIDDCAASESPSRRCDLSPLGWSALTPNKIAAAAMHGTTGTGPPAYGGSVAELRQAYAAFLMADGDNLLGEVPLFSADGDMLHDFIDCIFLGPYSRVDFVACDAEDRLSCPFYARDEAGGLSRNFTHCFGEELMRGDEQLPFTCGSQARRAIIKYFFRRFTSTPETTGRNLSRAIRAKLADIVANYTHPASMGCHDAKTGRCSLAACAYSTNGYAPCMDTAFELSTQEVGRFIITDVLAELRHFHAHVYASAAPWLAHHLPPKPLQWRDDPDQAQAAQRLSHFAPGTPIVAYTVDEVYSMSEADTSTTLWSVCTALLGHAAMSLPIALDRPIGAEGLAEDMADLEQIEGLVRRITRAAMRSASPFVWHKNKRHAPSPSAVCRGARRQRGAVGKLVVDAASVQTPGGGSIPIRPAEGRTFPLFGYSEARVGASNACICADIDAEVADRCVVPDETCASWEAAARLRGLNLTAEGGCGILSAACAAARHYYPVAAADSVQRCLMRHGTGVRCPELGPSDVWGLFPAGCTTRECDDASLWNGGARRVGLDGARFLTDGRGGLRLPNYRYVNQTYHEAIHYAQQRAPSAAMQQPRCFDDSELTPTAAEEDASVPDYGAEEHDAVLRRLFPAAQLQFDSPPVAVCSRYVVEVARAEMMPQFLSAASEWRRRCEAKIRQLASCDANGVFFDMSPPPYAATECAGARLPDSSGRYYFAAGGACVLVDRTARRMYDAPLCGAAPLGEACALRPQPLTLLQPGTPPYSMLFTEGARRLSDDWLANLASTLNLAQVDAMAASNHGADHISHVLDWWPRDSKPPPGYHPTAASDPAELAPMLFDTHLLYDPEAATIHYAHSAARDADLLYDTLGAAGVCRAPNVGMPMFNANTNRVCTRAAQRNDDMPHMPIAAPLKPTASATEICAESHRDTPWQPSPEDPQSTSVGGIPDWQRFVALHANAYPYDVYPPPDARLTPLATYTAWTDQCAPVWGDAPTGADDKCPEGTTPLTPANASSAQQICFSKAAFFEGGGGRQPCFRTDQCPDGMVCLADGGCAPLHLHVWNRGGDAALEFTVLADRCGDPTRQTMRAASPWERVPDLLHMHGFCSHANWFAYRNAIRSGRCSPAAGGADTLECNASNVQWPWVHERFDQRRASEPQTMLEARALFAVPHECDETVWHLRAPSTASRLEVCVPQDAYGPTEWVYPLTDPDDQTPQTEPKKMWMRAASEASPAHIAVLPQGNDELPLGFIGADLGADNALGDLAMGKGRFFRCADRMACQNPAFTLGGLRVERDISEISLRRCGSIGQFDAAAGLCWLDAQRFPLLVQVRSPKTPPDDAPTGAWGRSSTAPASPRSRARPPRSRARTRRSAPHPRPAGREISVRSVGHRRRGRLPVAVSGCPSKALR